MSEPSVANERELEGLRKLYGAKFNAIVSALGYAGGIRDALEIEDIEAATYRLEQLEAVLRDA